jgi:hypothetical protein
MIKLLSNSYDFGEPAVRIADRTRALVKSASCEMRDFLKTVQAEAGKTKLLVLAMGSGEAYGPNRNGDFFKESELISRHDTFEKHAHLYKHHINKDPKRSYGKVARSFYNPRMKRVELLVEVDNAKAPDIVKKANCGEDIPVSMSCRVPYDVCSICGNQSKTLAEYCGHLKESMTKILPDGRQCYAENPNPTFFDISVVYKPADRIAYVLDKVASAAAPPSAVLAQELGLSEYDFAPILFDKTAESMMRKRALLRKLCALEKEIEGVMEKAEPETPRESFIKKDAPKALVIVMPTPSSEDAGSLKHLLGGLAEHGVILSPQEFSDSMTGGDGPDISGHVPGIFFDFGGDCTPALPKSYISDLAANRSLFHRPAARRVMRITITSGSPRSSKRPQVIEKSSSEGSADMAVAYALYKIAALDMVASRNDELLPTLAVLQNYLEI